MISIWTQMGLSILRKHFLETFQHVYVLFCSLKNSYFYPFLSSMQWKPVHWIWLILLISIVVLQQTCLPFVEFFFVSLLPWKDKPMELYLSCVNCASFKWSPVNINSLNVLNVFFPSHRLSHHVGAGTGAGRVRLASWRRSTPQGPEGRRTSGGRTLVSSGSWGEPWTFQILKLPWERHIHPIIMHQPAADGLALVLTEKSQNC